MRQLYNFAFFDEASKREIRRAIIKGVSIPGHQIPFASREMPIGRGWGAGESDRSGRRRQRERREHQEARG